MQKEHSAGPNVFGIRHLSPAGAWHLRNFLTEKNPKLVLIEGPSDLNDQIENITRPETKPPIAILAYTKEAPVRTVLYPFAEYSPEYQAILWCRENGVKCRFMDLPSDVFLALDEKRSAGFARGDEPDGDRAKAKAHDGGTADEAAGNEDKADIEASDEEDAADKAAGNGNSAEKENGGTEAEKQELSIYSLLDLKTGEDGHETFWERTLEQTESLESYRMGAESFGSNLRELSAGDEADWPEILVREAFMRRQLKDAVDSGLKPEEIVLVTGAYHVDGLLDEAAGPMSDEDMKKLPRTESSHTLMPYSDYRLSSRSGYGAGNKAPAYYKLIWDALNRGDLTYTAHSYLSKIAACQRANGTPVSSAEVIEAVQLSNSLARLRGSRFPALRDLRDAAVTCLGGGSLAAISIAVADTEIGTAIGTLPDGVSRTSIQEDFYRQIKENKLERYRDITAQDLALDLRENRRVSSKSTAFLDLNRSFFLNRLRVLGISFAKKQPVSQDNATWSEKWILRWSPEAEIELVENALRGDTVEQAVSFFMKERVENAAGMSEIALVTEDAFECGMPLTVAYATQALQAMAVDNVSVTELAMTADRLSAILQYGSIRQVDAEPLVPILKQIFFRACLILPGECICDDAASKEMITAIEQINRAVLAHDFLDASQWCDTLKEIAERDDLNTKLSGFAAAVLLERGSMDGEGLQLEVGRRLSKGIPADLGAGWFEGLAMKNHYALIARLSLWEHLDNYLDTLDDEEFKRALVFLRRAFADFSAGEKDSIAENMGEIWGLNGGQVSETLNKTLSEDEERSLREAVCGAEQNDSQSGASEQSGQLVESLEDFDFDM